MPKPFFSIVIPFYNRASTLGRAIASVQAQTYSHWELVLVDDASTDASVSIASHASAQDSRIRVLTNAQNQERSLSRNRGIMAAQGRYICFLDSDDYHLPEHLSMLYKGLEKLGFPTAFYLRRHGMKMLKETEKSAFVRILKQRMLIAISFYIP
jgi:glycosyltransferase involved in cell wall biosynthesis